MINIKLNNLHLIPILETFNCVQIELLVLDRNTLNYLTVCK